MTWGRRRAAIIRSVLMFLRTIAWLACVIYASIPLFWLAIHPLAAYWRSRRRSPYRLLIPLWVGTWIVLGVISAPWRNISLYQTPWAWVPAAFLFATGLWIYRLSVGIFSVAQLGGLPEIMSEHPQQRLVISGIRERVRHPIYVAHLCEMLAWSAGTGLAVCYGLTVFAMIWGAIMIRLEDKELEQRFGEDYRAYRERVPAVLPRI
jgi:protein-S-isoprenylcysteine O-methyltransferase Ste14